MSEHRAYVSWKRETPDFDYDSYDRSHELRLEGGQTLKGSAAPDYKGDAAQANPEELLAASLSSCHMLTFLALAAKKGFTVDGYQDEAVASLGKNDAGRMAVTRVALHPRVTFAGEGPTPEQLARLHDSAHRHCMIANSVSCPVEVEE